MKLFIFVVLAGCATSIPKFQIPSIAERDVYESQFGTASTKAVTVHNPFHYDIVAIVKCDHDSFMSDGYSVRVPARDQKQLLVNINHRAIGSACRIADFDFIGDEE